MKSFRNLALAATLVALSVLPSSALDLLAPLGYAQATATGAAANLPSLPAASQPGNLVAVIVIETANIRWRDDGTDPTTSVGMLIASGAVPFIYTGNIRAFRFIAVSGSPVVNVSYYRSAGG